MQITIVLANSLPPWSTDGDLWYLAAKKLAQDSCKVTCLASASDTGIAHLMALPDRGVELLFAEHSESILEKLQRKLRATQTPSRFRAFSDSKPDLVIVWGYTPIDGLPWMKFCRNVNLQYSTVIEANSSIWWPEDGEADLVHNLLSGAERVFFFSAANRRLLELQLARPIDHA
jgi:hypothetical protein